jgi:Rrf2 family protein
VKLSGGVEWALHCCVVLTTAARPVPAVRLAELHQVSSTYLAKHLQSLSRAGLVASAQGKTGGYVLTRSPQDITALDVVEAIEGPQSTYVCTEIRQRGPMAAPPEACAAPCAIARTMYAADRAWRATLRNVSIADLVRTIGTDYDGDVLSPIGDWLVAPALDRPGNINSSTGSRPSLA